MKSLRFGLKPLNKEISTSIKLKSIFGLIPKKIIPSSFLLSMNINNDSNFLMTAYEYFEIDIPAWRALNTSRILEAGGESFETIRTGVGNQQGMGVTTGLYSLENNLYNQMIRGKMSFDVTGIVPEEAVMWEASLLLTTQNAINQCPITASEIALSIMQFQNPIQDDYSDYENMGYVRAADEDVPFNNVGGELNISLNQNFLDTFVKNGNNDLGLTFSADANMLLNLSDIQNEPLTVIFYWFTSPILRLSYAVF